MSVSNNSKAFANATSVLSIVLTFSPSYKKPTLFGWL